MCIYKVHDKIIWNYLQFDHQHWQMSPLNEQFTTTNSDKPRVNSYEILTLS